jgi:hypothetical protein
VKDPVRLPGLEGVESDHVHPPRVITSAYILARYNNNNNNNNNKFLIMNVLAQLDTTCRILKKISQEKK